MHSDRDTTLNYANAAAPAPLTAMETIVERVRCAKEQAMTFVRELEAHADRLHGVLPKDPDGNTVGCERKPNGSIDAVFMAIDDLEGVHRLLNAAIGRNTNIA